MTMVNYLSPIDRVEQLSNDYSDLKDKHVHLICRHKEVKGDNKILRKRVDELELFIKNLQPCNSSTEYDWKVIRQDFRVRAHFRATKAARENTKKWKKMYREMSDKYYSLLASIHNKNL